MRISVRMEGGVGDIILANRFVAAIREKYPTALIDAWLDTKGNTKQEQILRLCYPSFYNDIKTFSRKKYKEFYLKTQFGIENSEGFLENVPEDIRLEMTEGYDKFYDLHLDALEWAKYDFDWLRYFSFFPRPEIILPAKDENYIIMHLVSDTGPFHKLDKWYIKNLVSSLAVKHKCYIICSDKTRDVFDFCDKIGNVTLYNENILDIIKKIGNADMMISTDSGLRYLGHCFGVPTIVMSGFCNGFPKNVLPGAILRWHIIPEVCMPLNYDYKHISKITDGIMSGARINILDPSSRNFVAEYLVKNYTVAERSILN
jgi:ADP-heptose:LPS heptosyltransferase